VRLVELAAEEVGVLVGLEVAHPHDHRLGRERRGDHRDALGDPLHEEVPRRGVGDDPLLDPGLERGVELVEVQQRAGVDADLPVDDELQPGQPDAGVRQPGEGEGLLGRPTFIMILVGISGMASSRVSSTSKPTSPA
jgi:hypothetical protein